MLRWRCGLVLGAMLALAGCSVSTPFAGPDGRGANFASASPDAVAVLSITHITLKDDRVLRSQFWDAVGRIDRAMLSQPGLLGYSRRTEILGDEAWTATVWRDEASLVAFLASPAHAAAMREQRDVFTDARFARVRMPERQVPTAWNDLLTLLERNARAYYE